MKDYYRVLGIEKTATTKQVHDAFRTLGLKYHPDRSTGNEDKWKEINEAHQVLGDSENRTKYDQICIRNNGFSDQDVSNILNRSSSSVFNSSHSNGYKATFEEYRSHDTNPTVGVHIANLEQDDTINFGKGNGIWKYRDLFEHKKGNIVTFLNSKRFRIVRSVFNNNLVLIWPDTANLSSYILYSFNVLGYDNPGQVTKVKWSDSRTCWIAKIFREKGTTNFELRFTSKTHSEFPTSYRISWMQENELVLKEGPFRRMKFDKGKDSTIICWMPTIEQTYSRYLSRCRIAFKSGYNKLGPIPIDIWR